MQRPAAAHSHRPAPPPPTRAPACLRHAVGPTIWIPSEDGRLSVVRGLSDAPILNCTIPALLERQALAWGDNEAVVSMHQETRLSYRELLRHANEVAQGLLALGVQVRAWSEQALRR